MTADRGFAQRHTLTPELVPLRKAAGGVLAAKSNAA
jgi:hypothetical protein